MHAIYRDKFFNKYMKILIIAYYFPPDSSSGAFRPLFLSEYFSKNGHNIIILTASVKDFLLSQPIDEKLLSNVSQRVIIFRSSVIRMRESVISAAGVIRKILNIKNDNVINKKKYGLSGPIAAKKSFFQKSKDIITDLLALPDPHVGWVPSACLQGRRIINAQNVDLIFATGSPWSSFLIGLLLSKLTGVPFICDFRDPWVENPNFTLKSKLVRKIEAWLESMVVRNSHLVVANTEELRQNFLARYPFLLPHNCIAAPNGFQRYIEPSVTDESTFTLVHAGELYFSRSPLPLFEAIYSLLQKNEINKGKFKLILVGGLQISDDRISDILGNPLMSDIVSILPRMSYDEALKYQKMADVLLLVQPNFPLQVPRKLYEYMALQKPVLALTEHHGATARLIQDFELGFVADGRDEIEAALLRLFKEWSEGVKRISGVSTDEFLNASIAGKLDFALQKVKAGMK